MNRAMLTVALGVATIAQGSAQQPLGGLTGFSCDVQAAIAAFVGHAYYNAVLGIAIDRQGHYYVTARRDLTVPGAPHMLFEVVPGTPSKVVAGYPAPSATATSSWGLRDGATDYRTNTLYFGMEGTNVYAFDATAKAWDSSKSFAVTGYPGGTIRALTFDENRNGGKGSFLASDWRSDICEFDLAGNILNRWPAISTSLYGAYTDRNTGKVWFWSQAGNLSNTSHPTAQVCGLEFDPVVGLATGQEFHGDLTIPGFPSGGGIAGGAAWNAVAAGNPATVVSQANSDTIYEIWTRFEYAPGCGGDAGTHGGGAWAGNKQFRITLRNGQPLTAPAPWLAIHLVPGTASVPGLLRCSMDLPVPLVVAVPGSWDNSTSSYSVRMPIPSTLTRGFELFTQWIEPDPASFFPLRVSEAGAVRIPSGT